MSKYHLTEAYGNLYNPRKADETFYENLRFVDYLMQEEIEEVMESLLWEFMDYGNTLDESYGLIEGVFSDDVILEELISEAYEDRYPELKKQEVKAKQAAKSARREARKAAVTGALKKAGETVKGAATGTGSAAMGAMRAGKQAAAGAYERAKGLPGKAMAALKGLVRKGAAAAARKGKSMETAGERQSAAGLASRQAGRKGRGGQYELSFEPSTKEKSGGIRKAIGGLLKKAGQRVYRAVANSTTSPQGPKAPAAQGPRRPYNRKEVAMAKQSKAAAGQGPTQSRVGAPAGTFTTQTKSGESRPTTKKSRRETEKRLQRLNPDVKPSQMGEDYELLAQYILEDFINAGYADTYEDAFEILENLSEGSIVELTEMYLEG